jgi:mono/diheme cytochrome c family protein
MIGLLLGIAACGAPPPLATAADVTRATTPTTLAELATGRERYIARCGSCHRPYHPASYAPADWPGYVEMMAERAKLAGEERRVVELYVVTLAARPKR